MLVFNKDGATKVYGCFALACKIKKKRPLKLNLSMGISVSASCHLIRHDLTASVATSSVTVCWDTTIEVAAAVL